MNPSEIPIERHLKRLHLANARRIYTELADRAEREEWSYRDFLAILVAEEVAHRQQTRVGRLTRKARFPFLKTIEEFDFTHQSTLRLSVMGSFLTPDFVSEGRCAIFSGKPGRGKTHLAVALAYRAIQNGFDALFTTAAALIDDLSRASREGRLVDALERYTHPHVLVIDEVGYLSYGVDAANVLFHVVNDRHLRKRTMLFTTNKSLKEWGRVLHDEDLADAITDRVLERGRHLVLDGPSVRTRHLDETARKSVSKEGPIRVSGTDLSEFPEPTGTFESEGELMRHFIAALIGSCTVLCAAADASAVTVDITAAGWVQEDGNRFEDTGGNRNFVIGELNLSNPTRLDFDHRAFFVWDFAGFTTPVTSASFQARNVADGENGALTAGYGSPDPTETLSLYDVTDDVSPNGYDDLGGGTEYGTRTVSAADNGTFVTVTLNQAAIDAINAAILGGGKFAIGGALTTLDPDGQQEFIFGFSHVNSVARLVLNEGQPPGGGVPEPGSVALALLGAGAARFGVSRKS